MESLRRSVDAREPNLDRVRSGKPPLLTGAGQHRSAIIPPHGHPIPKPEDSPGLGRWVQGEAPHVLAESSGLGHWPWGLGLPAPNGKAPHVPRRREK